MSLSELKTKEDCWETIKKYEFHQDEHASHPWCGMTWNEIDEEMNRWRREYEEFRDFRLRCEMKSYGYGAYTTWYELQGRE